MPSKTIVELLKYSDSLSNREMMKWALRNVREVIDILNFNVRNDDEYRLMVLETNRFLTGFHKVSHMRNQALKMHEIARHEKNEVRCNLLRAYGHVIATAHVKEHALHATEYANKALRAANIDSEEISKLVQKQNAALESLARFIVSIDTPVTN
ncbi:MAG: hypothetical protein PHD98_01805 [Bacilli bacterium]|jgi:hypothetical protein|nr:hypothetical protein [Bacilli bacterium]MDD4005885.1 hypothetical protein [Bacilli bacterium]